MFDVNGPSENFAPGEESSGVSEQASEQARQQFASAQAAVQQIRKEEKKAKKRDDGVAQMILQFLNDTQRTHLATLISRLVAIDCPSPFILAILSLISDPCRTVVEEYLREQHQDAPEERTADLNIMQQALDQNSNEQLAAWMTRMEQVLRSDAPAILRPLLIDEQNIDGTVLQLTTFVLQEFLQSQEKNPAFENLQQVSIGILQSLFSPHMQEYLERRLEEKVGE